MPNIKNRFVCCILQKKFKLSTILPIAFRFDINIEHSSNGFDVILTSVQSFVHAEAHTIDLILFLLVAVITTLLFCLMRKKFALSH